MCVCGGAGGGGGRGGGKGGGGGGQGQKKVEAGHVQENFSSNRQKREGSGVNTYTGNKCDDNKKHNN